MEILFMIGGGIVVYAIIKSLHNDINRLRDRLDRQQEEFGRAIQQLQDSGLSVAEREVLDRLTEAAWKAKQRSNYNP